MNDDIDQDIVAEERDITPKDLLKFAKLILLVSSILFFLGSITEFIRPGNNIFECCKTILPSIVTLVIGYYFGKN